MPRWAHWRSRWLSPVQPARKYVYFSFSAGFNASFGTAAVSSNAGSSHTFLFDPKGQLAREWRGVKVKGHADEVLEAVKAI